MLIVDLYPRIESRHKTKNTEIVGVLQNLNQLPETSNFFLKHVTTILSLMAITNNLVLFYSISAQNLKLRDLRLISIDFEPAELA